VVLNLNCAVLSSDLQRSENCPGSKITHHFWSLCTPELLNLPDVILLSQMLLGSIITHHLIAYIPSDHLVMVVKGFNVVVANV
jgi:hypothetical protein